MCGNVCQPTRKGRAEWMCEGKCGQKTMSVDEKKWVCDKKNECGQEIMSVLSTSVGVECGVWSVECDSAVSGEPPYVHVTSRLDSLVCLYKYTTSWLVTTVSIPSAVSTESSINNLFLHWHRDCQWHNSESAYTVTVLLVVPYCGLVSRSTELILPLAMKPEDAGKKPSDNVPVLNNRFQAIVQLLQLLIALLSGPGEHKHQSDNRTGDSTRNLKSRAFDFVDAITNLMVRNDEVVAGVACASQSQGIISLHPPNETPCHENAQVHPHYTHIFSISQIHP